MAPIALNGRAHSGPNCWTDRSTGAVYVTSYNSSRYGYLSKILDGVTTTTDLSALAGNPLAFPADADDEHLALVTGMDSDRYVYVAGNMHGDLMRCIRFDTPGAITGSFTNMAATLTVDTGEVITYPTFASTSNGTLLLWSRRRVADASNNIGKWGVWRKEPGQAWTYGGTVLQDMPHDTTSNSSVDDDGDFLAYGTFTVGADDVIRVGTWWQDWGEEFSKTELGYIESADYGATWRNVSGTTVTTPLEYSGRTPQLLGQNPGNGFNDTPNAAVDSAGRPAVITFDLFDNVYLIRWNGSAWATTTVTVPTFTSRPRLVNYRGELWLFGNVNGQVSLRNVENPTSTFSLGPAVDVDHEPPFDPEAIRSQVVSSAFVNPAGVPVVRSFGGLAAARAA